MSIAYYGIEKQTIGGMVVGGPNWKPAGIVGVSSDIKQGYNLLRNALPDTLRAIPLDISLVSKLYQDIVEDKRVVDLNSFLAVLRML